MNSIQNFTKLVLLACGLLLFASGCKSHKKVVAMTDSTVEKSKMEQEERLRKQREDEAKKKQEEYDKREAESALTAMKESAPKVKLNQYFEAIAGASNAASANSSINEALTLFASVEAPVLIVISEEGGNKDYDRPTTITAYLNYLKDQKKNINDIANLKVDAAGKITEVELKKNK